MYEKDGIVYAGECNKVFSILSVKNLGDYKLLILFSNNKEVVVDCKKLLDFKIFEELKDINVFNSYKLDGTTLTWLDGNLDIAPEYLFELSSQLKGGS